MKVKYRKARPQPPRYYWWDSDNCWDCNNRNNCGNCKRLKEYKHSKDKAKRHKIKSDLGLLRRVK